MNSIGIVTDSHSGISQGEAKEQGIMVLPMPFYFGDDCYYENITLTREEFFQKLDSEASVTTSQPSPEKVMEIWDEALQKYESILYIPISSGLSGSCMTAKALAQEEKYEDKVFVVDNGRVSTPMHRSILDAVELIEEGYSAEEIQTILENARERMVIYVGVETLEYLRKGGRVTSATAALGSVLNIKPILKFDVGVLDTYKKCRGFKKVKKEMIKALQNDLETKFKEEYEAGEVYLLAASSASKEATDQWIQEIQEAFPGMDVMCDDLSLGVSCHIGPGGLGIGCSCRPKRKK